MRPAGAAAAAGLLGAAAAGAAKLALGARPLSGGEAAGGWLPVLLHVGCIGLVCACNAVMWTVFAKALRLSSSSASASVTTTASNFISSAILGKLLFGETWTPLCLDNASAIATSRSQPGPHTMHFLGLLILCQSLLSAVRPAQLPCTFLHRSAKLCRLHFPWLARAAIPGAWWRCGNSDNLRES
ncbi:uncharacterized protein TMEM42 [Gallus gallus]|uniref:uncharacterized protein TMEM42 n=1 Tax=Gallus gallus TaxID=9031 RepID=UPI001F0057FB|nr:uncharacterized protein TMEM42 [Gallus gallus]